MKFIVFYVLLSFCLMKCASRIGTIIIISIQFQKISISDRYQQLIVCIWFPKCSIKNEQNVIMKFLDCKKNEMSEWLIWIYWISKDWLNLNWLWLCAHACNLNAERNDNSVLMSKLCMEPILKLNKFINETVCSKPFDKW